VPDFKDQLTRLEQANRRAVELSSVIEKYATTNPASFCAAISEDRLHWEMKLVVASSPPTDEWGLIFGEVVNHLRSVLENLVVAIARQSGITDPKDIKRLAFPIAATEAEWQVQENRIEKLPSSYRDAIRNVQPFLRLAQGMKTDGDLLLMLRDLSNEDKHHLFVKPQFSMTELQNMCSVEFASEDEAFENVPPQVTIFNPEFANGALVWRQDCKTKIVKVSGAGKIGMQIQVVLPGGKVLGLTECLGMLNYYTRVVFDFVTSGGVVVPKSGK
jgi:hypothetical protein